MTPVPVRCARGSALSPLGWILLAALVLRVAFALTAWLMTGDGATFSAADTPTYVAPARGLLEHGTFTTNGVPEVSRTPGYPLLLIPGLLAGRLEAVTIALQILLSLATVAGVYRLALEVVRDRRAALAAAALYAVEPLSVQYTALLLTETMFAALLVWALWLGARHAREGRPAQLVGAAALLAASVYVRPAAYLLPFLVPLLFAAHAALRRQWRRLVPALAAAAVGGVLLFAWQARNSAQTGFSGFSTIGAHGLYFYSAAGVMAAQNGITLEEQQDRMGWLTEEGYLRAHPAQRGWTVGQRAEFQQSEAKRVVLGNLPIYLKQHARGAASVLLGTGAGEFRTVLGIPHPEGRIAQRLMTGAGKPAEVVPDVVMGLFLLTLYGLAGWWLLASRREWNLALLLLACVAAYLVLVTGPVGGARFRQPVMPVVCLGAGAGLALALRRRTAPALEAAPAPAGHPTAG